jgi:hypothetical protein
LRCLMASLALILAFATQAAGVPDAAGEAIYRLGVLTAGKPLMAQREADGPVSGADAACANCHRRSGLGGREGRELIPPIAGAYLFHPKATEIEDLSLPYVEGIRPDRDPYTDATLARAVRSGIDSDGRELSYLMPRYDLSDADMAALIGYLKKLDAGAVPGVSDSVLHFATIVTPDADPDKRAGVLDVLNQFFKDKNVFSRGPSPQLKSIHRMKFRVVRGWQLHVWELTGPPETWEEQLHARSKAEPVFAVISGLGGKTWGPVEKFCESEAIPCLFPNVDLPTSGRNNSYTVYFSRGVLLEAALIAHDVKAHAPASAPRQLVQIFRAGDVGEAAAHALEEALKPAGIRIRNEPLAVAHSDGDVTASVKAAGEGDVLVLWLRPDDIASLGPLTRAAAVYASAVMGGADNPPFPAEWRKITRLAQPFDLPDRRRVPLDYPLGWFNIRRIPVVSLQVQADTFLACQILAVTLRHMFDAFNRDYLMERLEDMAEKLIMTGYYRRLSLGPGQRVASKGGYILNLAEGRDALRHDAQWIIP